MKSTRQLRKDITGQRFGMLTVVQRAPNQGKHTMYECRCDCGETTLAESYNLRRGAVQSCGCRRQRKGSQNPNWEGHGEISLTYWSGVQISAEKRGWGVAVSINDAWTIFQQQERRCALSGVPLTFDGYKHGRSRHTASLDRIDSTKGYVPGNVQWIHKDIQKMKWAYPEETFLRWVHIISDFQRRQCEGEKFDRTG